VFFNDDLTISKAHNYYRGRKIRRNDLDGEEEETKEQNLVPVIKRNLTPDDHLNKREAESYLLVDPQG
jgi:hypothetical protein